MTTSPASTRSTALASSISSTPAAITTARSSPPTNINSYITGNAQIAIPSLDITTAGQSEWFFVNVPSTTTGTMTVTVQSSNLSSLAPSLQIYNSSRSLLGQASAPNTFGATISLSTSVSSGQGYYVKVTDAGGPGPIGGYGLLLNFGSQTQSPIPPPNTVVAQQPDGGSGTINNSVVAGASIAGTSSPNDGSLFPLPTYLTVGTLSGWTELMVTSPSRLDSAPDRTTNHNPSSQVRSPSIPTAAVPCRRPFSKARPRYPP